jgi:hypothetical protein
MKYITSLFLALILAVSAFAQQTQTVTIPENMLTQEQRLELEAKRTQAKIETYGKWVGMGEEFGKAADAALTAVEKHADSIADTKVGMFTMAIIGYKVIGKDLIRVILGVGLAIVWVPLFAVTLWRNAINFKRLRRENFAADGKTVVSREYETTSEQSEYLILYGFAFLVMSGVTWLLMFA